MNIYKYSNFLFYRSEDVNINVQVIVDENAETILVTQQEMAEIFRVYISGISRYISNIPKSSELDRKAICKKCNLLIQTSRQHFIT